jgi:hypothetical protein
MNQADWIGVLAAIMNRGARLPQAGRVRGAVGAVPMSAPS